jgi:hypothetical protein
LIKDVDDRAEEHQLMGDTSIYVLGVFELHIDIDPAIRPGSVMQHEFAGDDMSTPEHTVMLSTYTRSENIINTITEYTIDPQSKIEETTQYYYQTLEVGQQHTMDPIMEGILSCSLASSRGHPPIELPLQTQYFSSCLITLLESLYIVLPSPKNILEDESSRSRTF